VKNGMSKIAISYNNSKNTQEIREGTEPLPYNINKNTQVTLKLLGLFFIPKNNALKWSFLRLKVQNLQKYICFEFFEKYLLFYRKNIHINCDLQLKNKTFYDIIN